MNALKCALEAVFTEGAKVEVAEGAEIWRVEI